MIKGIIFDYDGTLVSSKELHFNTLNKALNAICDYSISFEDHVKIYDGLSTRQKLNILQSKGIVQESDKERIWTLKQEATAFELDKVCAPSERLIAVFKYLKYKGYKVAIASNAIRNTLTHSLNLLRLSEYIDLIVSNEDVANPKPHPEIYLKASYLLGLSPLETLVFEDADNGILSAKRAGCNVSIVRSPEDIEMINVIREIYKYDQRSEKFTWECDKMNVLIPCAGLGSRFAKAGYTFPKPLIEIRGKPMIECVVNSLNIKANYIFIVQQEHYDQYNLKYLLNLIAPNCKIVTVNGLTEGAACTSLLAKEYIDNNQELLIANSDQLIEWDNSKFFYYMRTKSADGGILTFKNSHPKWSYVKLDDFGNITEVAEKKVISDNATCGIYYWKKGSDYVKYAEQMIQKNIRVNNEFYICPVTNEAIQDGKIIKSFEVDKMYGVGTPEDLSTYLEATR